AGYIGMISMGISWALSMYAAWQYFIVLGPAQGKYEPVIPYKMHWVTFGDTLSIDMGILLDPISVMMLVVVTTVSFLVHIYSRGYMHGDEGFARFYAYLSLFSFSMLALVLATNLFQIYIFWELVGVSSFLLIGYYFIKPSAIRAAKKAFIVTRFADFFFLIGILMIAFYARTLDLETLNNLSFIEQLIQKIAENQIPVFLGLSAVTWALILIFIGAAGKSAMFPLHIWLPDAMEGPTPVSALIHAATMVVAGVYLVARLFPMYYHFDNAFALRVVAVVGAFSALFAAIIALTQEDIKRVLAYSTMSQIGYMMMALGVSGFEGIEGLGYMAGMFHLFTHAMFKALLFLAAGVIIHAVHSNLMKDMGGLHKYLPVTSWTFLIAALAISGIPPLAGFYSKDEILHAAFEFNKVIWLTGFLVAGLTAFYMFRLYFRIFHNQKREYAHPPKEDSKFMTTPLIILAVLTFFVGWALTPFSQYVSPTREVFHYEIHWGSPLVWGSILIGLVGIAAAYYFYYKPTDYPARVAAAFGKGYEWAKNKFYIDEAYLYVTKNIIFDKISRPAAWFDRHVVDGMMNSIAYTVGWIAEKIKPVQSGRLQEYAIWFVYGVVMLILIFYYFNY
ncbi:MAG: NADH-quinone oxidoreductase subunit L, partial [Chlorobi bacterium]|nr:NADH-quinone oxidoreductase subunit L [Chlorobiota bacterium]